MADADVELASVWEEAVHVVDRFPRVEVDERVAAGVDGGDLLARDRADVQPVVVTRLDLPFSNVFSLAMKFYAAFLLMSFILGIIAWSLVALLIGIGIGLSQQ